MKTKLDKRPIFVATIASVLAILFLNRWVLTDLGVLSFGRTWQYFVSWGDFGFARRELWGTALTYSGLNSIVENTYAFSYGFYALEILVETTLLAYYCATRAAGRPIWFFAALFLSPVLILQSGYITGTQDLQVLIIASVAVLYANGKYIIALLCAAGILTHELFIFMIPAVLLIYYLRNADEFRHGEIDARGWALVGLFLTAVAAITVVAGTLDVSQAVYESKMAGRIPAAVDNHGLWSGYYEVSSSVESNTSGFNIFDRAVQNLKWSAIPLLYLVLLILGCLALLKNSPKIFLVAAAAAVSLPLLVSVVATDFYRWLGMSANLCWLLILVCTAEKSQKLPNSFYKILLIFVLFAPFGAAEMQRPFPAQQLLYEKLTLGGINLDQSNIQFAESKIFRNVNLLNLPVEVRGIASRKT